MFKYHRFLPQDVLNKALGDKPIEIKPKEEKKDIIKTDDKLIKQMIGGANIDKTKNKIETEKEILPGTRLIEQYLKLDKKNKKN